MGEAERDDDREAIDRLPPNAGSSTSNAARSTDGATRPDLARQAVVRADTGPIASLTPDHDRHSRPTRALTSEEPAAMADPLDKQLVEAVLSSRPRRAKAELEEAKLATMRPVAPARRWRPSPPTRTPTTTTMTTTRTST